MIPQQLQDYLAKRGFSHIHAQNDNGDTPLLLAVAEENYDIVVMLLEAGVKVNLKTSKGKSVMYMATLADSRFSELLIQAGGVVNEVYQNRSLLMHCIELIDREERYKQVGMFLWGGADVNFTNSHGWTAWMMAQQYHPTDIRLLKLLEESGAQPVDIRPQQIFYYI
ncbi:MAG: ankyrin repeat domain-containing protein, partial [bacterium]|nr:ankyrin repeat domain-containing protein [bacterium]